VDGTDRAPLRCQTQIKSSVFSTNISLASSRARQFSVNQQAQEPTCVSSNTGELPAMSRTRRRRKSFPQGYGKGLRLIRRKNATTVKTTRSAMRAKGLQVPLELPTFKEENY
jgi:hypothetical protein